MLVCNVLLGQSCLNGQLNGKNNNNEIIELKPGCWLINNPLSSSLLASVLYLNSMSVTWTARIQIFLTCSKLLALAVIIVPGMYQLFKGKTPPSFFIPNCVLYILSTAAFSENICKRVIGITQCHTGLTMLWALNINVSYIYRKAANYYSVRAPTKNLEDAFCCAGTF